MAGLAARLVTQSEMGSSRTHSVSDSDRGANFDSIALRLSFDAQQRRARMLPDIDLRSSYYCCYRAFAIAAFAVGLLVKPATLWHVSRVRWWKAGIVGLAITVAWWTLDVIVIGSAATASVLLWNVMLGFEESHAIWFSLILLVPAIRAALESLLITLISSRRVGMKGYGLLCLADETCIAVAIYAMILYFRAHPAQA